VDEEDGLLKALRGIAPYYDLDFAEGDNAEIDCYINFARRTGSPVLELGVGTGRIAVPLAKVGFSVVGLDISPNMLQIARSKLAGMAETDLRLIEADITDFRLEERFALVLIPLNGFYHLRDKEAQLSTLNRVWEHLREEGLLILDVFNPDVVMMAEQERELAVEWTKTNPANGRTVTKLSSFTVDRSRQTQQLTFFYDEIGDDTIVRRTVTTFDLRYMFRYEAESLLEQSGFVVEAVYGSHDLDEFEPSSPRMLIVARRRAI
jgi:ubiquinone/menaquinone biosynthesis C-methylase UbiE